MKRIFIFALLSILAFSCTEKKEKGFQVSEVRTNDEGKPVAGLPLDSVALETRPGNILLTTHKAHRLTPVYKVNYNKKNKPYTGHNRHHHTYDYDAHDGNNWNDNFMPGLAALYGYNFINVSHYNTETQAAHTLFEKPVVIKTLYYPAYSKDTLNLQPVRRNYYLISAYDEDTNKDGFINLKDLRRFYHFDLEGQHKQQLIPPDYSVLSSEYDPANDYMYIVARKDSNKNGQMELQEPTDIFWIDLSQPEKRGIQYKTE